MLEQGAIEWEAMEQEGSLSARSYLLLQLSDRASGAGRQVSGFQSIAKHRGRA